MPGRILVIVGALGLVLFTAALWYFQNHAFYEELPLQPLVMNGREYPVESWQGIDAATSPLKRRVCLTVASATAGQIRDDLPKRAEGEPLVAPYWFECFDAKTLARDLAAGEAGLYMIGASGFDGIDEVLALYPDGRGFIWRQLKPEFRTQ